MIAWLAYCAADLVVRRLPRRLVDRIAIAVARLAFHAGVPARRAHERNLERLLGRGRRREVRRRTREAFEHFALALADFLRLERVGAGALERSVEVRGGHHLEAALASGRGVVLLTAHVGNWEWGAAWLAARGVRLHLLARPHGHPRVERLFLRRRHAWGVGVLPATAHARAALGALRRGDWVALMADRAAAAPRPARAGSPTPSACRLAAALARRCGALVLPAVMIHLPGRRYAACFEPPVAPDRALRAEIPAAGFGATLRRAVARHPGQWCAFEPAPGALA